MASNAYTQQKLAFSKNCLFDALIRLMQQKDISKITISELTELSGISRSTFYRNYDSIEGIVKDFIFDKPMGFDWEMQRTDHTPHELVEMYFDYLLENKTLFLLMEKQGLLHHLLEVQDFVFKGAFRPILNDLGFEEEYEISAFVGIVYMVTQDWIKGGMKEDRAQMVELSTKIITSYGRSDAMDE